MFLSYLKEIATVTPNTIIMKIKIAIVTIIWISTLLACTKQSTLSYDADIAPLLVTCANQYCHGGGAVSFVDYDSTVQSVNTGRLIGALKQEPEFKAMPFGNEVDGKWSDEDIETLEKWIADGMPK